MNKIFEKFISINQRSRELQPDFEVLSSQLFQDLLGDRWLQHILKDREFPLSQGEIKMLVESTYLIISPILCQLVASVQTEFPNSSKICPFRSGQIFEHIASCSLSGRESATWASFDYPVDHRFSQGNRVGGSATEVKWLQDYDVKRRILRPNHIVLVDWGCSGSVLDVFNQFRRQYRHIFADENDRKTFARFLFSTDRSIRERPDLASLILLPEKADLTEEELQEAMNDDPQIIGKLNLAQITHDCCRGIYGPRDLNTTISDTLVGTGIFPNRPKHPNPWVYARNSIVMAVTKVYAMNQMKTHKAQAQEGGQFDYSAAFEWAEGLTEEEFRLFSLAGWEMEVLPSRDDQ